MFSYSRNLYCSQAHWDFIAELSWFSHFISLKGIKLIKKGRTSFKSPTISMMVEIFYALGTTMTKKQNEMESSSLFNFPAWSPSSFPLMSSVEVCKRERWACLYEKFNLKLSSSPSSLIRIQKVFRQKI